MSGTFAYKTNIDEASATVTYIGRASTKAATSEAQWQIVKIEISGNVTTMKYANGSYTFDQIWDNRASLTYT